MDDIVASVGQVNDIIARISAASAEQARGIAEVNQAVGQMDDVTQQNAALVEQAAAAAASLQEQAVHLSQAVAVFQLDDPADVAAPAEVKEGRPPSLTERLAEKTRAREAKAPRQLHGFRNADARTG